MEQENINRGRDQFVINQPHQVFFSPQPVTLRDPVLETLLGAVQHEVKERLAQSLHRAARTTLLNLGKALEPHRVRSPWSMEMSVQACPPQMLPAEMTIAQVFELSDVERKLLILGEPGSGKTTTLLELAYFLVEQASADPDAPIPVLVNLSSWKDPQQPIFDWWVGELKSKYGLRPELGRQFLVQNRLLPFLDGLDEVAPICQEACAAGLNTWFMGDIEQQPVGAVVCCRPKEYEEVVRKHLVLHNSVALQPLSDGQIKAYLTQFQLAQVWESVQVSPQLQDILRKPLFLAVFGLVAPQFDFSEWQRRPTDAERIEYLFDRFWIVVMDRALVDANSQSQGILSKTYGKKNLPSSKKVRRALIFAAKGMEQESRTELLIEKMQPTWLRQRKQRRQYLTVLGLIEGLVFGPIIGLIGGPIGVPIIGPIGVPIIGPIGVPIIGLIGVPIIGLIGGLVFGLIIGLIGGLIAELDTLDTIEPVEVINISISRDARYKIFHSLTTISRDARRKFFHSLTIPNLINGLIGVLGSGLIGVPIIGLIGGLIGGLIIGLIRGLKADIESRIVPNQGIKNSRQNMLIWTGFTLLLAVLFTLLLEQTLKTILPADQVTRLTGVLIAILILPSFLVGGGQALMQHIALRIVLAYNGYAPYRYDKLLDYCTERLLLQRIGGRYRFMHKLLQEHFAKMPLN